MKPAFLRMSVLTCALALAETCRADLGQTDALAPPPGLSLSAEASETHDSNVTRQASGPTAIGSRIEHLGLRVSLTEGSGRNRTYLSGEVGRDSYDALSLYNATTQDLRAGWTGQPVHGVDTNVHLAHAVTLANQADLGAVQRNLVTRDTLGGWIHVPAWHEWHLVGTADTSRTRNSNGLDTAMDADANFLGAGFSYIANADEDIGLLLRSGRTRYPSPNAVAAGMSDAKDQYADLNVHWRVSGSSALSGRLGYQRHTYDLYSFRNASGPAYDLSWLWTPGAHFMLTLSGERSLGGPSDNVFLSGAITRLRAAPGYAISDKIKIEAHVEQTRADYTANLQLLQQGLSPAQARNDSTSNVGIGASWQPRKWLGVGTEARSERRTSSMTAFDYRANVVLLRLRALFE